MERTARARITNFLDREEVTFDRQASPSFQNSTPTALLAEKYRGRTMAAVLTSPFCADTPAGENRKGQETNAGYGNGLSVLLTT
jgi:hypothetical protein